MNKRPHTIFLDIDGCILKHMGNLHEIWLERDNPVILPGVVEAFNEWESKGYRIILTTGRKESMRELTVKQLAAVGIYYDHLLCGLGGGARYLINDLKPNSDAPTAIAINLKRNEGLTEYINL